MRKLLPLIVALVATALLAAGCGGDDDSDATTGAEATGTAAEDSGATTEEAEAEGSESQEGEEHAATPAQAIAEIGVVRTLLAQSLAAYRAGDAEGADTLTGDAYLEHFELVEGPLEERDEHLNEELEEQIREELRSMIKAGAPAAEVAALVKEINSGLDRAEKALGS
jgi:hypothetical protein